MPTCDLSSKQVNFDGNYPAGSAAKGPDLKRPCDVGLYLPNPLGIYDLVGNVWEWTSSEEGSNRVFRGGDWFNDGWRSRAGDHCGYSPDLRRLYLGFRLAAGPQVK